MTAGIGIAQTLVSALVTVVVGLVALVAGSRLTRTREHRKWLKEQRVELYAALAEHALVAFSLGQRAERSQDQGYFLQTLDAETAIIRNLALRLRIVGSPTMSSSADAINDMCDNQVEISTTAT